MFFICLKVNDLVKYWNQQYMYKREQYKGRVVYKPFLLQNKSENKSRLVYFFNIAWYSK